jgi:hypothetical protein
MKFRGLLRILSLRRLARCALLLLALTLPAAASADPSPAPAPALALQVSTQPTSLTPAAEGQQYEILLTNIGAAASNGTITVTDTLPAGITTAAQARGGDPEVGEWSCTPGAGLSTLTCTFPEPVAAFAQAPVLVIPLAASEPAEAPAVNQTHVSGGGAVAASTATASPVEATLPFGLAGLHEYVTAPDGTPDSTAGAHPYAFTMAADLNTVDRVTPEAHLEPTSVKDVKDVIFDLPPGFLASALATPTCTFAQLGAFEGCPRDTRIGHLFSLPRGSSTSVNSPLFNMVPERGVPAEFGFVDGLHSTHALYAGVAPTQAGYVLRVTLRELPQIALTGLIATIYGDPAAADESGEAPRALLTNPARCGEATVTTVHLDSWQAPGAFLDNGTPAGEPQIEGPNWVTGTSTSSPQPLTGCQELRFQPSSFTAKPDTTAADAPTGLTVLLQTPQSDSPLNLATPPLRDIRLALPTGLTIDASAAGGLQSCSEAQVGWIGRTLTDFTPAAPACPQASTIGSVEAQTPLIAGTLHGSLYLAAQGQNPLGALLGAYLVIDDPTTGVVVKIAGELRTDPVTGQITALFTELPQLPLSDLRLRFFGGERGLLATPQACGTFTTSTDLGAWSAPESGPDATPSDSFPILSGCSGAFAPSLLAGTISNEAGSYSPFTLTLSREDPEQQLAGIVAQAPPGMLAKLASIPMCPDAQASDGTCPAGSQVGHASVTTGVGPNPYPLTGGRVYLTGPYNGGPFGLSIVLPALAGPFDLGNIVIRASLRFDPANGQITIVSDQLPQMIDSAEGLRSGIPADLRTISLSLDRPEFTVNPTSCEPMSVKASITGAQGAIATPTVRFQAADCAKLKFTPTVTASTSSRTSLENGATLHLSIAYPHATSGTQAAIEQANFQLPRALPARLSTIQHACLHSVFVVNPAACPPGSVIGTATVRTPLLTTPLSGPVYFLSNGAALFPEAVIVLQGDGLAVELHGRTSIDNHTRVTSAMFEDIPDVPLEEIAVTLPQGPHSEFVANLPGYAKASMCGQQLALPSVLKAQNGMELRRSVPVQVTGCPSAIALAAHSLRGSALTLRVYVPGRGRLIVRANGLGAASKRATGQDLLTVTLHAKRSGRLRTRVWLNFAPAHGAKQSKTLMLDL